MALRCVFVALVWAPLAASKTCLEGFVALGFDIYNFDKYTTYFTDASTLTLAFTGTYTGTEDIQEYMLFATEKGPFVSNVKVLDQGMTVKNNATDNCQFLTFFVGDYTWDPKLSGGETIRSPFMMKISYDLAADKITSIVFYDPPAFLQQAYNSWDTPATAAFICKTMKDRCADVWSLNKYTSQSQCVEDLDKLTLFDYAGDVDFDKGGGSDGKSKACRMVHSALAQTNAGHCPHISTTPVEDKKGRIKCQDSSSHLLKDGTMFDDFDRTAWADFATKNNIDTKTGLVIVHDPNAVSAARLASTVSLGVTTWLTAATAAAWVVEVV